MENQLRITQDVLTAELEDHIEKRESLAAYNAQMQAFMVIRNKNTFISFITFSDIYVCYHFFHCMPCSSVYRMHRILHSHTTTKCLYTNDP
jgi:hypothetical protein